MRKTKIICTIGPASQSPEKIREMILAGMNVCRCNFSHGSYEEQKAKLPLPGIAATAEAVSWLPTATKAAGFRPSS